MDGRWLRRRFPVVVLAVVVIVGAVDVVAVPSVDNRRGILEGDGRLGRGTVEGLIEERRLLGGIIYVE